MKKKVIFMFSGQGSQYYQMGKELYERNARFRFWMNLCDEIYREYADISIIDAIYRQGNKTQLFDNLLQTNPALFSIQYSMSRVVQELGVKPDFVLGYSIGELIAAVVAGVISLEDGAKLAIDYAGLISARSPRGTMVAVMDPVSTLHDFMSAHQGVWVAGKNFSTHYIVSGLQGDIDKFIFMLDSKKIIHQRLPVNYAFHSPALGSLKSEFERISQKANYRAAQVPIISPSLAASNPIFDISHMWNVVSKPVHFEKTIRQLIPHSNFIFVDLGPSGTLATFVKYVLPRDGSSQHMEVMNAFGKDVSSLNKVVEHFSCVYE